MFRIRQKVQPEENFLITDEFVLDLSISLDKRFEDLACTEGYQILVTNKKLYKWCSYFANLVLFSYLSLLLYDSIHQWQSFNNWEIYINDQCPWGIFFILLALVQLFSSTPSYNMVHMKYKELQQLLLDWALVTIGMMIGQKLNFNYQKFLLKFNYACYQIFLGFFIITIEYFQKTFWDAILYLVALDFLGQIQKNLCSQIFMWRYNYCTLSTFWGNHKNYWFFNKFTFESVYYFFWEIKKLNNIKYLPFDEMEEDSITTDLYKKIHDLYFDLEHEYGFRFALLNDPSIKKNYVTIKSILLFFICIFGSIASKIYQSEDQQNENNDGSNYLMGLIYILISIPIIIIQGAGYSLYNYKERSFFVLVNDYKYLCLQQNINPQEFLFPFNRIRNYYYYRNFQYQSLLQLFYNTSHNHSQKLFLILVLQNLLEIQNLIYMNVNKIAIQQIDLKQWICNYKICGIQNITLRYNILTQNFNQDQILKYQKIKNLTKANQKNVLNRNYKIYFVRLCMKMDINIHQLIFLNQCYLDILVFLFNQYFQQL